VRWLELSITGGGMLFDWRSAQHRSDLRIRLAVSTPMPTLRPSDVRETRTRCVMQCALDYMISNHHELELIGNGFQTRPRPILS